MDHRLDGVRRKIKRAEKHLNLLNRSIDRHLVGDAYVLKGQFEPEASDHFVVRVHAKRKLRSEWPLVIGDIAHNLRSALDHLAWQLAGPNPPDNTEFPIFRDSKKYNRKDNRGPARGSGLYKVRGMSREAQAAIRALQPYRRPHGGPPTAHPLWLLHELNRVDKHQVLQVAAFALANYRIKLTANGDFAGGVIGIGRSPLEDGAKIHEKTISVDGVPHPKVKVDSGLSPDIAFGQGPCRGRAVIPTLFRSGSYIVTDVLPKLEPLLPPR